MSDKPNGDHAVLFPKDTHGREPIAWIVEPKDPARAPYLTAKADVAEKRYKAGDHVTPYSSQNEPADDSEEL